MAVCGVSPAAAAVPFFGAGTHGHYRGSPILYQNTSVKATCVGLEEDGVVDAGVPGGQGTLHDHHALRLPHLPRQKSDNRRHNGTNKQACRHAACTAQLSTAQHSTAYHSTSPCIPAVKHSTVQHSTAQHSQARHLPLILLLLLPHR